MLVVCAPLILTCFRILRVIVRLALLSSCLRFARLLRLHRRLLPLLLSLRGSLRFLQLLLIPRLLLLLPLRSFLPHPRLRLRLSLLICLLLRFLWALLRLVRFYLIPFLAFPPWYLLCIMAYLFLRIRRLLPFLLRPLPLLQPSGLTPLLRLLFLLPLPSRVWRLYQGWVWAFLCLPLVFPLFPRIRPLLQLRLVGLLLPRLLMIHSLFLLLRLSPILFQDDDHLPFDPSALPLSLDSFHSEYRCLVEYIWIVPAGSGCSAGCSSSACSVQVFLCVRHTVSTVTFI